MTTVGSLLDTLDPVSRETAAAFIRAEQLTLIDRLVRAARRDEWCGEFERSMAVIFPDGHPDTGSTDPNGWTDSDGFTCRGTDRDGYRQDGYHYNTGRTRDGYDYSGWDQDGYNRDGFDRYGRDRDGRDCDGFDRDGFDRDDRDRGGNLRGSDEADAYRYRFYRGYDVDGFSVDGLHQTTGLNRHEHANRFRFDASGNARPSS